MWPLVPLIQVGHRDLGIAVHEVPYNDDKITQQKQKQKQKIKHLLVHIAESKVALRWW